MVIKADQQFSRILSILNAGGIVILPTETLYGLICAATSPQALLKIYQLKNRAHGKAFPLLVKDVRMLGEYAILNQEQKEKILKTKSPTTFVLKAKNLSPLATQKHTAAFRIARHPLIKKIFRSFDRPLVATSANLAGKDPIADPRSYEEIFRERAKLIEAVVFAGINRKRKGSKIVDLTKKPYTIIRS